MMNRIAPCLKIVVAMDLNRTIGNENRIPWKIKADLRRFKELTTGHTVVMGRKTCESIVDYAGGPLKGRRNIVLSRNELFNPAGFEKVSDWRCFMDIFEDGEYGDAYVIGGAEIYAKALPRADYIYITHVCAIISGDVRFPNIGGDWETTESSPIHDAGPDNEFDFYYETLKRIKGKKA